MGARTDAVIANMRTDANAENIHACADSISICCACPPIGLMQKSKPSTFSWASLNRLRRKVACQLR
jgi:hypothetical protein